MKTKLPPNIVEHAATGFRMPEPLAAKIEALSRNLPADFRYRRMARKSDSFSLDPGQRTDVSVINTGTIDREGECVLPGGGDWSSYNRVVTFAHCYDQLPVGSNWWIRAVKSTPAPAGEAAPGRSPGPALVAKTHYPPKPADWGDAPWLPSAVLHFMQQPVPTCTGKSIGFQPLNVRSATGDELRARPELRGVPIIDKWVGVEYAVVPVPCNPDAEMQAVAKGMELGFIDQKVMELIEESGRTFSASSPGSRRRRGIDRDHLRREILKQIRETFLSLRGEWDKE